MRRGREEEEEEEKKRGKKKKEREEGILLATETSVGNFKVNGHRLKPYIGEGPPTPHSEELQSLEISATS